MSTLNSFRPRERGEKGTNLATYSDGLKGTIQYRGYDIADIVGLTPVHVNRVLKTLRAEGLVELASKRLRTPDLDALRSVANG